MNIHPHTGIVQDTLQVVKKWTGLYSGKSKTFVSCGQPGLKYLAESTNGQADTIYKSILPAAYPGEAIYMEMTAALEPSGDPQYAGILVISTFEKAEQKSAKNTCIPYDYWCSGTEPFWQLEISEKEGLIDFYNASEQEMLHFPYARPAISNGVQVYSVQNGNSNLEIKIKNEKGSDGMSERSYSHKAIVVLNKNEMTGGAALFGEN